MKFVDLEEIWQKFPNKYQAIIKIAKEVRKINELRKPVTPEPNNVTSETAAPKTEPAVIVSSEPKKRGRRPKKGVVEEIKPQAKNEPLEEEFGVTIESIGSSKKVIAEKAEENPYAVAIKKILKNATENTEDTENLT